MPNVKIRIESTSEEQELKTEGEQTKLSKEKVAVVSLFAHQAINTTKQIVSYEISNVGIKTGNLVLQEEINQTVSIIGDAAGIGLGFAAGGPLGGLAAIAGVTLKSIFRERSYIEQLRHQNVESEYLLRRSGNSTTSGSRGTEN